MKGVGDWIYKFHSNISFEGKSYVDTHGNRMKILRKVLKGWGVNNGKHSMDSPIGRQYEEDLIWLDYIKDESIFDNGKNSLINEQKTRANVMMKRYGGVRHGSEFSTKYDSTTYPNSSQINMPYKIGTRPLK